MVMFLDIIIFLIVGYFLRESKWRILEYILIIVALTIGFFLGRFESVFFNYLTYGLLIFLLGIHYTEKMKLGFNISFLFLISGIMSIVLLPGHLVWSFFGYNDVFSLITLQFFIVKYLLFGPIVFLLIRSIYKKEIFVVFLNRTSHFINLVFMMIFGIYDSRYFERLGLDSSYYFDYLFTIVGFFYLASIYLIYVYYLQDEKNQVIHQELDFKSKDLDKLLNDNTNKLLNKLRQLSSEGNIEKIIEYSEDYLEQNYHNSQVNTLSLVKDEQLEIILNEFISKNKDVIFDIKVCNFTVEHISSQEEYFLEMFGIIFDNAIEGATRSLEKQLIITFEDSKVIISNSYLNTDLTYLQKKSSRKGDKNRVNGLKILSYLNDKSDIVIISKVDEMVTYEMVVLS